MLRWSMQDLSSHPTLQLSLTRSEWVLCHQWSFHKEPKSTSDDVDVKEAETRVLAPEKAVPAEVADARARRADLGHLDRVGCIFCNSLPCDSKLGQTVSHSRMLFTLDAFNKFMLNVCF